MTLSKWIDRCTRLVADKSVHTQSHYERVGQTLIGNFGATRSITDIKPGDAADFVASLKVSANTKANYVRYAKAIFQRAVREELIDRNPFRHESGTCIKPKKDWIDFDGPTMDKLLDVAPTIQWKRLFALCRWAGMRASEARHLKWSDFDNSNHTVMLTGKGGRNRRVPLDERVWAMMKPRDGNGPCDGMLTGASLSKAAAILARRAGLEESSPLHDMRRCCAQDWRRIHGDFRASEFLGHSAVIAAAHYDRIGPADLARVTGVSC